MRVVYDRTFGREIYFVVKKWRPIYRYFNRLFCDMRRPISFSITDNDVSLRAFYRAAAEFNKREK
jgi:hypothetical protein